MNSLRLAITLFVACGALSGCASMQASQGPAIGLHANGRPVGTQGSTHGRSADLIAANAREFGPGSDREARGIPTPQPVREADFARSIPVPQPPIPQPPTPDRGYGGVRVGREP
jgi:hypothetical protein